MSPVEPRTDPAPAIARGLRLWLVTLGGIGLWLVHLGAEASFARYGSTHRWAMWLMNTLTVALAAIALLATLLSRRIALRHRCTESHASVEGRTAFVGWLGVFVGATNVVLIILEGLFVAAIRG